MVTPKPRFKCEPPLPKFNFTCFRFPHLVSLCSHCVCYPYCEGVVQRLLARNFCRYSILGHWLSGGIVCLSIPLKNPDTAISEKKNSRNFNLDTGNYSKKILELQSAYFLLDVSSLDTCLNFAFRGQFAAENIMKICCMCRTLVAGAIH